MDVANRIVSCCLFSQTRKQLNHRMMNRLLFNDFEFWKAEAFQANTFLHLWSLCNQSTIWKLLISLHRFFFFMQQMYFQVIGSFWFLNVHYHCRCYSNSTNFFSVALNSSNSVLYCFVCSLWLFVAQNYVYSRHIIRSVKYYPI